MNNGDEKKREAEIRRAARAEAEMKQDQENLEDAIFELFNNQMEICERNPNKDLIKGCKYLMQRFDLDTRFLPERLYDAVVGEACPDVLD